MSSGSFKNVIKEMCLQIVYLIYMYKLDLALDNLQGNQKKKKKKKKTHRKKHRTHEIFYYFYKNKAK